MNIESYKLLIATPCYGGQCTSEYTQSMLTLARTDLKFDVMFINNESLVNRARNSCVAQMLRNETYTHLLFIDADIGFRPDQIAGLINKAAPVVAGIYPKKKRNWDKAHRLPADSADQLRQHTLDYVVNVLEEGEHFEGEEFDGLVDGGYMRVAYAGTGFMLIERQVFEKMRAEFPECQYADDGDGYDGDGLSGHFWNFFESMIHPKSKRYLSEDFGFCYRWRSIGGRIYVNAQSQLTHVGRTVYTGDTSVLRKDE